ncbi:alpha/beta hydrolase [Phytomonospora sp. NPDC050363]|uniref:alpha/beta fold hydrolase n=1 Tax=Phytomonospora sp. NPDC050363 TaxID=3155642 RepID=UPI0033EC4B71
MSTLEVPGADLHFEATGSGPVLLLIPGGNGDAAPYAPLAAAFADRHTVVAYDRRGYSRSRLHEPVDPATRLDADVADVLALIDAHGDEPAHVFGSSSGAVVGLHLLARHPSRVRVLVAHEPPLVGLLPDAEELFAFLDGVRELYRTEGVEKAMRVFNERIGIPGEERPRLDQLPAQLREMLERVEANLPFFLEHELTVYPRLTPEEEPLAAVADKLVLAGGEDSRDHFPYRPNIVLGARLGLAVNDLPGDHIGYISRRETFPAALAALFAGN